MSSPCGRRDGEPAGTKGHGPRAGPPPTAASQFLSSLKSDSAPGAWATGFPPAASCSRGSSGGSTRVPRSVHGGAALGSSLSPAPADGRPGCSRPHLPAELPQPAPASGTRPGRPGSRGAAVSSSNRAWEPPDSSRAGEPLYRPTGSTWSSSLRTCYWAFSFLPRLLLVILVG